VLWQDFLDLLSNCSEQQGACHVSNDVDRSRRQRFTVLQRAYLPVTAVAATDAAATTMTVTGVRRRWRASESLVAAEATAGGACTGANDSGAAAGDDGAALYVQLAG